MPRANITSPPSNPQPHPTKTHFPSRSRTPANVRVFVHAFLYNSAHIWRIVSPADLSTNIHSAQLTKSTACLCWRSCVHAHNRRRRLCMPEYLARACAGVHSMCVWSGVVAVVVMVVVAVVRDGGLYACLTNCCTISPIRMASPG